MKHEEAYSQMMMALDDELTESGHAQLQTHLQACPDCMREWQALLTMEAILQQAPMLMPAADFAQRTLAKLPHRPRQMGVIVGVYLLLLVTGILPLLTLGWLGLQWQPMLAEPAWWRGIGQMVSQIGAMFATFLGACWQLFLSLGTLIGQEPALLGFGLVMVGMIAVWVGVYQQLMSVGGRTAVRPSPSR